MGRAKGFARAAGPRSGSASGPPLPPRRRVPAALPRRAGGRRRDGDAAEAGRGRDEAVAGGRFCAAQMRTRPGCETSDCNAVVSACRAAWPQPEQLQAARAGP